MDPGWGAVREDGSPLPAEERAPMLALRTGQSVRGVIMGVRHSDGRLVWLSCNAQPYFGQDAKTLAGVVASFFDVTAQRAASSERERLLGEVEAARVRLETLFENAPAAICTLRGPDHVFELINPTYQRLVGLGRPLVGLPVREALPELVEQGFIGQLDEVYRSGIAFLANEVLVRLNRRGEGILEDVFIYQLYQPVRDASGQVVGIDVFGFDVTEQVRARKEAERLMGLEKERASFEQQLIGIVSHDLRNPVAAIMMGASILLRRPDVEERQRRTTERILVSAGRANRMIHDLLDFTQARLGGGLRVKRVPGDFHAILRQVVEESQVSSPGRVLRLVQQGSGEGAWDGDRLAQLVSNLLANAVHYSPPDSTVNIEMRGEPNELVLTVHNAGAPIPLEVLPYLFQPMQRGVAEVSEARSVGLGLYIVDQVVRAHRGSVEVASTAETGTTFTVRLPRAH
jgi:signal transduction histidine kinase